MVTIKNYHLRQGEKGAYVSLELTGDVELVQSSSTGRFYATARRCFIFSTFDEQTARMMVGKQMPGSIKRVPCEAYDYVLPETGEVIRLGYRFDYTPEDEVVVTKNLVTA